MRLVGFVVGMMGVLAAGFAAVVMTMVTSVTGHAPVILVISVWLSVALAVAGVIFSWWLPRVAAISLVVVALWMVIALRYVAMPAGVLLAISAGLVWFEHRRSSRAQT